MKSFWFCIEMKLQRVAEDELVMESADSVNGFDRAGNPGEPLFPIYHFNATALSQILPRNATVLDLFCGSAQFLSYLLLGRPDLRAVGMDLSRNMLELAKINLARLDLSDRVQLVHGDAAAADTAVGERVDAVSCLSALHHCPTIGDLISVLEAVKRLRESHGCGVWLFDLVRPEKEDLLELIPRIHEISAGKSLDAAFKSDWMTSLRAGWTCEEMQQASVEAGLSLESTTANHSQLHWAPPKAAVQVIQTWTGEPPSKRDLQLASKLAASLKWHHLDP
ncbi:MAG: class I SAM-dependent methyltransferase [Planctomycetota bacterium]